MWETIRIADFGSVITGKTPSSNNLEHFGDDYPFITPTDIDTGRIVHTERGISQEGYQKYQHQILPRWSVCFVCIGATIGKICMTTEESLTNQQINSVVVNTTLHDPFFVYYLLSTYAEKVKSIAGGAATPIVNKTNFENITVPAPPLNIQRKIATILSAYDNLIENNLRRIKILEEMAQDLYREWFVNFRFPGHQEARFVDSPLGKIPEGWRCNKLKEVCDFVNYGFTASANYEEIGPKFLRITDIVPDIIDWDKVPYCKVEEDEVKKYELLEGDIVIARTGATTGYAKRLNKLHPKSIFASYLVRIRPNAIVGKYYTGVIVESNIYKEFIKQNIGGAAQPQANAKVLTSIDILMPTIDVIQAFDKILQPLVDKKELLQIKNRILRHSRDLLLPRLISGEVDVSELDIVIPNQATI